jgi:hypothetical protein
MDNQKNGQYLLYFSLFINLILVGVVIATLQPSFLSRSIEKSSFEQEKNYFMDKSLGVAFNYTDEFEKPSIQEFKKDAITQISLSNKSQAADLKSKEIEALDGLENITVQIHKNPSKLALRKWLLTHKQFTNFEDSTKAKTITVAGQPALSYTFGILGFTDTVVFLNPSGDTAYQISYNYNEKKDDAAWEKILETFKLI